MLTDSKLKMLKPTAKEQNYSDGKGTNLYYRIKPNGSRTFIFRYTYHGTPKNLTLGKYPDTSLKIARTKVAEYKSVLAKGMNPLTYKIKQEKATGNKLKDVALEWFTIKAQNHTPKNRQQILAKINNRINPALGDIPIHAIEALDIVNFLRKFEAKGNLAQRNAVKSILNQIFSFASATGLCQFNPVLGISNALKPYHPKHFDFLSKEADIAQLLYDIDHRKGHEATTMALKLAPLVLLRPTELAGLKWSEVDLANQQLIIDASRMKMRRTHVVPLSTQAFAILEQRRVDTHGTYVFPSKMGGHTHISIHGLSTALRTMGYDGIQKPKHDTHGFRHMGSTKLYELSAEHGFSSDIIEKQLAHQERNRVKATYNHAEYLPERRRMMQIWADYLGRLKGSLG